MFCANLSQINSTLLTSMECHSVFPSCVASTSSFRTFNDTPGAARLHIGGTVFLLALWQAWDGRSADVPSFLFTLCPSNSGGGSRKLGERCDHEQRTLCRLRRNTGGRFIWSRAVLNNISP